MSRPSPRLRQFRHRLNTALIKPQTFAFLPALMLGGYWFGGEGLLTITAVTFPMILMLGGLLEGERPPAQTDALTGLANRDFLVERLDAMVLGQEAREEATIAFAIQLDDFNEITESLGSAGTEEVLRQVAGRILGVIRPGDIAARLIDHRFALVLSPVRQADLEVGLRIAGRLQAAIAEPISLNAGTVYVTASIGFCLARRAPQRDAEAMLQAAEVAMDEARRSGHGAVRAFSPEMREAMALRHSIHEEIQEAFDKGEIRAWFQPQVSAETGLVTGFEALARWNHPSRGVLLPEDFLDAAESAGLMERLGEAIFFDVLSALRLWDKSGYRVPRVGLNFAAPELRNPRLVDRIRWELDRFELTPDRLSIEILETVVSETGNDTVTNNIAALATLGCDIDLDDFGTGHASIANIRRFAVGRIKIDRSFVTRIDKDPDQQKMVAAILSMAQQLDLETLAEGVETPGEHALVAQLGCDHVQGYCIAPPMAFEETMAWLDRHNSSLSQAPALGEPGA